MNTILIVGKPNSGKSLLFNRLTGLKQKVANFPGVTVEVKSGTFEEYNLMDFPGIYSLNSISKDEEVAVEQLHKALHDEKTSLIICTLDSTRLERSLIFSLQAQALAKKHGRPIVFALNMIDEVEKHNFEINIKELEKELGSPVFALSGRTQKGVESFKNDVLRMLQEKALYRPEKIYEGQEVFKKAREISQKFGLSSETVLKNQNKIDHFLLNNILGGVFFFAIMFFVFQSIFTWAAPAMDLVEESLEALATFVLTLLPTGVFADFIQDALFGGLGSFLVFLPQIMILTFLIGILEDSGYLARAALICHRPLSAFGLTGKSFIPYLTGHACAIPAIMAARTIESPRKRLLTVMTIPLMSCSARLPVYALLISAIIPNTYLAGGLLGLRGVVFFGLYLFGLTVALLISVILSKAQKNKDPQTDMPFILELPPYRLPHWKPLLLKVYSSAKSFVTKAGPIIFFVSVLVWFLGYFPNHGQSLETSFLGQFGQFIAPVFGPIGVDWKYGVAILVSFLAREVFVGTLGTLYGLEGADENITGLAENIQQSGLSLGTGVGLLIFYVVALQCVATVAVLKSETGSHKLAWGLFVAYGLLAYFLAFLAHTFI